ncbi:hypothetical protein [Paenibacillus rigui]|uniref:Uncharacterized protein n=1 Tax=Paenibacillus rigui TaxID=554312 RepID=A0A229UY38_9BACL|nr:hypothetical protein [Paenibacillus rigui]OXM88364.1 hypothetical protein CF651_00415 [Paenibacillus rigui]
MFIRFHGKAISPFTNQPYGIFAVIYFLKRDGKLSSLDLQLYETTVNWFEEHLPNPPYYDDLNNSIRAVTWFKDNESTRHMINNLQPFFDLAEKYSVEIIKSVANKPPGTIVYEDALQIGVTAFAYPAQS